MPPWLTQAEVYGGGLPFGEMFREILLAQISIAETRTEGSPKISKEKDVTNALNAL